MGDKVLVVDNHEEVLDLLSWFLKDEGYEVITAKNGAKAIQLAKSENPNVILLDLKMPGLDGIQTCKWLKTMGKTRFIPIIMITGFADNKMDAIEAGVDDFLNKAIDLVELSLRVRSLLRPRYLTGELKRTTAQKEKLQKSLPKS